MSLETALTEEPLPNGDGAAQHAASKHQLNPQSITLMSLSTSDYGEASPSESREGMGGDTQGHDIPPPPESQPESEPEPEPEADAQILEALRSAKDRLFVLKLGESMESLIQERHTRNRVELTPASTYHKLLVHRCAAYYKLTPETEAGSKAIAIVIAAESRIPARRVAELVPPDDSPLPAFKIMRRNQLERTRHKPSSQGGSGNDDNGPGDMSDGDPSENGSSRGSRRKPLTMSERQAQYEEARSRIFKDLEEKEKKAQDMSASSSTLSLLSAGSSSGGAGEGGTSSVGESLDETGSMDRDWMPSKDTTDGGRRTGSASGTRRSTAPPFNGHGHSPGFNYPTLYEPAPTAAVSSASPYESSPSPGSSTQAPYQPTLYPVYQYGAPAYLAPFPYPYYPYGPPHPHAPPQQQPPQQQPPESNAASTNGSAGSSPADAYPPPIAFVNPYVWGPPPPPPPHLHSQPPQQQSHPQQPHTPQSQQQQAQGGTRPDYPPPHPPYSHIPMHAYSYPPTGGYLQPLPPQVPYPHNGGHPQGSIPDAHRPANQPIHHVNGTASQPQLFNTGQYDTGTGGSPARNGGSGVPPKRLQPRSGWSYGPGVGGPSTTMNGETVGPRMGVARRTSGGSGTPSGHAGTNKTPGDESASTASSSTSSSSSRQTFTSNSSKHPLPARPDWAVGLKPQPTLHHSASHHSSPRSHHGHLPSQTHSHHHPQQRTPLVAPLQSNDFPPLPVSPPNAEKRPAIAGVWAGPSTTRNILGPSLGRLNNAAGLNGNSHGNGNGTLPSDNQTQQNTRLDEPDRAFERPGPKAGGELFNPNGTSGSTGSTRLGSKSPPNGTARKAQTPPEKERVDRANARGEAIANAILVDRAAAMRIGSGDDQGATKNVAGAVGEGTAI